MIIADSFTGGLSTLEVIFYILACVALVVWLIAWLFARAGR